MKMRMRTFCLVSGCVLVATPVAMCQPVPSITQIGENIRATLVSADGAVAAGLAPRAGGTWEAFRWSTTEGMTLLGVAPHPCDNEPLPSKCTAVGSAPFALSADGSRIVGANGALNWQFSLVEPFIWDREGGIRSMSSAEGFGVAISGDGQRVIGSYFGIMYDWTEKDGWRVIDPRVGGAEWPSDRTNVMGIAADASVIPGGVRQEAVVWDHGVIREVGPKGAVWSGAQSVSADGHYIVGWAWIDGVWWQAFRWSAASGVYVLPDLPGSQLQITDSIAVVGLRVAIDGTVIANDTMERNQSVPVIWRPDGEPRVLADYLHDRFGLDLAGWNLGRVTDMTPDGRTLVGYGTNPDGAVASWIIRLPARCAADFNDDAALDSADFFAFLDAFFCEGPACTLADFNADGVENSQDFFDFLGAFFGGCP